MKIIIFVFLGSENEMNKLMSQDQFQGQNSYHSRSSSNSNYRVAPNMKLDEKYCNNNVDDIFKEVSFQEKNS